MSFLRPRAPAKTESQIAAEALTAKKGREEAYEKKSRMRLSKSGRFGKSLLMSNDDRRGISDTLGG